jgi:hypothetical protein
MHPWLNIVKFTRTSSKTLAIAVTIARAASRKDNLALFGYQSFLKRIF